jgi:predicted DNA-binding antitoxin AbrB/MazE fold protein
MAKVIEAIYEKGVFKPLEKVDLKEGERVKIKVERSLIEIIKSYQDKFKLKEEDIEEFLRERR